MNEIKDSEANHTVVNFVCIRYPFQATPNLLKAEHWHRMREYLRNNRKYLKALKAQDTMSFVRDCLVKLCLELFVKAFVYQATVAKHSQYYIYCSVRY